jgi:hypothetical protein
MHAWVCNVTKVRYAFHRAPPWQNMFSPGHWLLEENLDFIADLSIIREKEANGEIFHNF